METDRCYLTEYLINKLNIKDGNVVLKNVKELRKIVNKYNYKGSLKRYDEIGPKLVRLLSSCNSHELDLMTYSKIKHISNLMDDLEVEEAAREAEGLIDIFNLNTGKSKKKIKK